MATLDAAFALLVMMAVLVLAARGRRGARWVRLLCSLALAGVAAQAVMGDFHWQMVPLTAVAVVLLLLHVRAPPAAAPDSRPPHLLRRLVGWAGRGLAVVLALAAGTVPALFPMFRMPDPGGPFGVGTGTYHFVDAARGETFTEDPDDFREIPVRVWYPTDELGDTPGIPYMENPELAAEAVGVPPFMWSHLDQIETWGVAGASLSSANDRFPVLVFSHGYVGDVGSSTYLMEAAASQGYVVFSLSHPYQSMPVQLESGLAPPRIAITEDTLAANAEALRIVEELWATEDTRENYEELLRRSMAKPPDLSGSIEIWAADGRFLLDRIEALAANDPTFGGRLDLERIGVFGHSFGGAMAAEVCRVDARCVAGINLDGTQYGMAVDSGVPRPFMFMYSEPERWLNHIVAVRSAGPVYQAAIMGSGHLDFADMTRFTPLMSWGSRSEPIPMVGTIGSDRMHEVTKAYVLAFFDRYLLGTGSPLLEGPSLEYPEVRFEAR